MKLRLQITVALLAAVPFTGFAQQVPNGDLENWTAHPGSSNNYESADGWDTPDALGAVFTVTEHVNEKSDDAYSGSFSAQLTTKDIVIPIVGTLTVPGTLALGTIVFTTTPTVSAGVVGGYPMDEAPDAFTGYYKYSPAAGDSMSIAVIAKSGGAQIGGGQMKDPATVTEWTMFNVPIEYGVAVIPDTILVIITSSGGFSSAVAGSVLKVDALAFTGISSASSIAAYGIDVDLYPNPAADHITMNNPLQYNATMEIFNLAGEKLDEIMLASGNNTVNLEKYASGIYMYRLNDNGKYVSAGKFQVAK